MFQSPIANLLEFKLKSNSLKALIATNEDTPLELVLELLKSKNILSLPIYRIENNSTANTSHTTKVYTGIVSTHEIMSFAYFKGMFDFDAPTQTEFKETFFQNPIKKVIEFRPKETSPIMMDPKDSIEELLNVFRCGNHRVLVASGEFGESEFQLITQTDVLRYALSLDAVLDKILDTMITYLYNFDIVSISSEKSALDGYCMMSRNNINVLPILNTAGTVIGNLCSSHLRDLTVKNANMMMLPVADYLGLAGSKHFDVSTVFPEVTLRKAISVMLNCNVHYVWVIDNYGRLSGLLTMTDVIALFSLIKQD